MNYLLAEQIAEHLADTILSATMRYQHATDLTTADFRAAAGLAARATSRDAATTPHVNRITASLRHRWNRPAPTTAPTLEELEQIEAARERIIRAQETEQDARVHLRRDTTLDNALRWRAAREEAAEAHADYLALTDTHYPDRRPPRPPQPPTYTF